MAKEEFGKLSPEQIQKLAGTISEAKNLTNQQEEIIKKVLKGETEIGNLRIASLEEYFDIYSRKLDLIARKHSALNDTFLILDNELTENYKSLSSDITKLKQQLSDIAKAENRSTTKDTSQESNSDKNNTSGQPANRGSSGLDNEAISLLREINKSLLSEKSSGSAINYINQQSSDKNHFAFTGDGGNQPPRLPPIEMSSNNDNNPGSTDVRTGVDPADRFRLGVEGALFEAKDTEVAEAKSAERLKKILEELYKQAKDVNDARVELALSRSQKEEDIAARSAEAQIAKIKEVIETETKAQNALNSIETQLAGISPEDFGKWRAEQVTGEADLKAALELEKQIVEYRANLEYEARSRNNGILTAEEAEANERLVREEFADRAERLTQLKEDQFRLEQLAKEDPQAAQALEKKKVAYAAKLEREARLKNNGIYTAADRAADKKRVEEKYKLDEEAEKKLGKQRLKNLKEEQKEQDKKLRSATASAVSGPLTKEHNLLDRFKELKEISDEKAGDDASGVAKAIAGLDTALVAISNLAAQLETSIDKIASYKGDIDTRLQGSNNAKSKEGSYWDQLSKDMMSVGAVTPFFKQEDFANNIKSLVDRGISFDLKQRAFLMTIQEKIATTFEVADGTLLRLIRLQQEDSTAGRLGMESALNSFLNEMYENTEYLKGVAESVRGSLQEMEALMTGAEATEVEYQVQKWMGSLYSVGMSQDAVQKIAGAFGQLAAGEIEALTSNSGAGNLLVMAANEAGIPIADILTDGLDAEETNKLLQATVNYLAEIAESSKDNRVVQQQLAGVFGVKASDLRAATNLATDDTTSNIFRKYLTYDNMLDQLNTMMGSLSSRTSIGEMMANVWANGQYSIAGSMASSPGAYLTYKLASLLDSTVGGIKIPDFSVMGTGVSLNTTVADLMRVAAISGGVLGSLGPMIEGLSSSFDGQAMLTQMGIESGSGLKVTPRGTGVGANDVPGAGGGVKTTSGSGYVGNASGSDIKNSTLQEAENTRQQTMIEALEETEGTQVDFINTNVLKIYELLDEVTSGKRNFTVKVAGYGLTNTSNGTALSSAQGGVAGLLSNNAASSYGSGGANSLSGGFGVNGSGSSGGSAGGTNGSTSGNSSGNTNGSFGLGNKLGLSGWTVG